MTHMSNSKGEVAVYFFVDAKDTPDIMIRPATEREVIVWTSAPRKERYYLNIAMVSRAPDGVVFALVFLIDEPDEGIDMQLIYSLCTDYLGQIIGRQSDINGFDPNLN